VQQYLVDVLELVDPKADQQLPVSNLTRRGLVAVKRDVTGQDVALETRDQNLLATRIAAAAGVPYFVGTSS
jgi:hypothetical protein